MPRGIKHNLDIVFQFKILENLGLGKYLPQLGKVLSSIKS